MRIFLLFIFSFNLFAMRDYNFSENYNLVKNNSGFNAPYRDAILEVLGVNIKQNDFYFLKDVKVGVLDTKSSDNQHWSDQLMWDSHGKHINGIIKSLTKSKVYSVFYQNKEVVHENKKMSSYMYKLSYLMWKYNPDVVNISGGQLMSSENYNEFGNLWEKKIIEKNPKTIFVCAAGNENVQIGKDQIFLPSSHDLSNIISVTSLNRNKIIGNYGDVDFGIHAVGIPSQGNSMSTKLTGSSQATAIMTSAIARIKRRYPDITISQVKHILKVNSFKKKGLKYGEFSYESFNLWMNKKYKNWDVNKNRYSKNPDLLINHLNKMIVFL